MDHFRTFWSIIDSSLSFFSCSCVISKFTLTNERWQLVNMFRKIIIVKNFCIIFDQFDATFQTILLLFGQNLYLLKFFLDKICIFWNNFGTFLSFWNLYHYHQLDKLRYFPEMSTLDIVVVSESSSQKRLKPLISNSSHLSASGLQFRQKDFATFNQNAITPAAKLISENFSLLPYLLPYY